MADNRNFEQEKIRLPDNLREIFIVLLLKDIRLMMWDIFNVSRDETDLFNFIRVLLTLDSGVSHEINSLYKISPGSDIPASIVHDIIRRLKENGIWDQLVLFL